MFSVGDHIVYPLHGAGTIVGVEEMEMMGVRRDYFIIHVMVGNLTVQVPVENAERVGIRYVVDRAKAESVVEYMRDGVATEDTSANWSKRYKDNMERISSGDIDEVANIVKALTLRDMRKSLSTGERKMLGTARHILASELAFVLDRDQREMEDHIVSLIKGE